MWHTGNSSSKREARQCWRTTGYDPQENGLWIPPILPQSPRSTKSAATVRELAMPASVRCCAPAAGSTIAPLNRDERDIYRACGKGMTMYTQMKELTQLRKDQQFWRDIGLTVSRGVLKRVDRSFKAFFRRVKAGEKPGYPRFKPHQRYQCLELASVGIRYAIGMNAIG